jgi:hypothetical protein
MTVSTTEEGPIGRDRRKGKRLAGLALAAAVAVGSVAFGSSAAQADASGCNGDVCISVTGNSATGYTVVGTTRYSFFGHLTLEGPNWRGDTGDWQNPNGSADGRAAGLVCVIGWQKNGTTYTNVGEPCETVS